MRHALGSLWLITLAAMCACSDGQIVEDAPMAVTVRYDGVVQTLDDATATARKACAAHGKTAQLRNTDVEAAFERFAHFACVSA
jgi:hypothetical protein